MIFIQIKNRKNKKKPMETRF